MAFGSWRLKIAALDHFGCSKNFPSGICNKKTQHSQLINGQHSKLNHHQDAFDRLDNGDEKTARDLVIFQLDRRNKNY